MSLQNSFVYGKKRFDYALTRRGRKTLSISVLPDMTIEVVAPHDATSEAIDEKVRRRAGWIIRQLRYFAEFQPRTPARKYVSGESHLYLGRRYRLKVVQSAQQQVKLKRGFIEVHTHRPSRTDLVAAQLADWYRARAVEQFKARLEACIQKFHDRAVVTPTGLIVRQMAGRWGSMSPGGRLVLNRRLIQAAAHEIDYVIVHELCHRRFHHHGPEFYKLLSRVMPDWEKRKTSLEKRLI